MQITVIVQGMAYSMGSVVLQAASPGRRLAFPHSWIMIHEPAKWAGWQSTTAAAQHLDRLKQMQSQIYRILAERSGKPLRQIIRDTKRTDFYLDAGKAKEYGLIDDVLGRRDARRAPTTAALAEQRPPPTAGARQRSRRPPAEIRPPTAERVRLSLTARGMWVASSPLMPQGTGSPRAERARCRELGCSRCRLQMPIRFRRSRRRAVRRAAALFLLSSTIFGRSTTGASFLLGTAVMASAWFAGPDPLAATVVGLVAGAEPAAVANVRATRRIWPCSWCRGCC